MNMIILNRSKDITLLTKVEKADTFFGRLKGLLGKGSLSKGEGLLIKPCSSVHTIGMKFPIDVAFVDKDNKVIHIIEDMKKGKVSPIVKKSKFVLEAKSGAFKDKLSLGDRVEII